ncbi:1-acyl-sn-glycerol-3-phosphate acyltransferase [Mangrovivirga sp. M17]|uniref:Glycerol-3-phosphate acyltransferase n=1 Tax=Mangrovivirga halotolerans TaxID=2993936 RepID=A0ABT3RP61_9BACT|nr:1-acyl-sn-glycerol-3-phosphate acyltransferase [Mangrovivirga halotolerans]MCX2743600.1 1-acyl-sn-glycerol-3-phosphate acyltransferase [Mangrovivirga halotolerans]
MQSDESIRQERYKPIIPAPRKWPVVQLSKNSKQFIEEVIDDTFDRIKEVKSTREELIEELETTLYREKLRVKRNPWKVDPPDDAEFWAGLRSELASITGNPDDPAIDDKLDELLKTIISRYANEILSKFKPSSYRFARSFVKTGFTRLLNATHVKGWSALWSKKYTLNDQLHIVGETEHIRTLAQKGTIVLLPTHFSNLDSILIGWVIHSLGLPPFIYGAGLNLFNIGIIAYFMNSLGAYKVDRRKKNLIYIETLKTYSNVALQKGVHSLFFPGGTRARSGHIEKKLKRGLLGSVIDAQRINYEKFPEENRKIFVVPVTINYHFTLEAPALINDHLKMMGQERFYMENDEYATSYKILKFLVKFFTKGSSISVSIGKGMDVLGNYVDDDGHSYDKNGQRIYTREYFMHDKKIERDDQRDAEYTKILSEKVVKEFHKINRVFSSHLVAFTAFKILQKKHPKLDLYNLLRLPDEDQVILYEEFKEEFNFYLDHLKELNKKGEVGFASHMNQDVDKVIKHGVDNVGMYHAKRPLIFTKSGDITSENLNTLFYYHNRMMGYGLEDLK